MKLLRVAISLVVLSLPLVAQAQTTAFTYQGSLAANGSYANGTYSFQFALFDNVSGGAQIGSTLSVNSVTVTNGTFSALLDSERMPSLAQTAGWKYPSKDPATRTTPHSLRGISWLPRLMRFER